MPRSGQIVQLTVLALLGLGTVVVYSAGMTVGSGRSGLAGLMQHRHGVYAILAVVAMLFTSRVNVRQFLKTRRVVNPLSGLVVLALALVALALVPGMGRSVNGASRWLYLGPKSWGLSFQPSEVVKWVMVLAIACWCTRRRGVMHRITDGLLPPLILLAVACGLIVLEDLGTAALIGLVGVCTLIAGGARLRHLAMACPAAVAMVVWAIARNPYRVQRLTAFLNPWADPLGSGYHPIQSMVTIAQGGLTGRGLGNGIQKFGYLPEDTTDFIFAIICEELGTAGAVLVIGLYLILLWVGLSIIRDCKDTFGRLLGLGVLLTVGLQALINLAVVTVVVPTKGIALPLLSAGGTGWILTAAALGLVASLDQSEDARDEPTPTFPTQPTRRWLGRWSGRWTGRWTGRWAGIPWRLPAKPTTISLRTD